MNRYESYKDSGIPWLGEVPEHWEIKPSKYVLSHVGSGKTPKGGAEVYVNDGIMMIRSQNVYDDGLRLDDVVYITDEADNAQKNSRVLPRDILLNITGASIGRVSRVPDDFPLANVNQHVCILRAIESRINSQFLMYYFQSYLIKSLIKSNENGTSREGLNFEQIKSIDISLPPLPEQTAIADYLDNKLGEIDALISKQETLLEKLAEQRTAIITHAVTKGLNAHAPMKNSGVAWLGDVPEHWNIGSLKYLCCVKGGYAFASEDFSDDGIAVIRISDILSDGTVNNENCKKIPSELAPNHKDSKLYKGQLVMAMTGATIGKISVYHSDKLAYINQRVGKFEIINSKLDYGFLGYILKSWSYQEHIKLTAFGGAQPNISDTEMVDYQIALPTLPEQTAIANYLDEQTAKIDRLSDTVNQTIARLKEYRSALITQAVTGKIKVI